MALPLLGAVMIGLTLSSASAKNLTWAGGGASNSWYAANWTGGSFAQSDSVRFELAGSAAGSTNVTNTVDQNSSVINLAYAYNSATNYHVTQINSGVTLTVGATMSVGLVDSGAITNASIIGDGKLMLTNAGQAVTIGNRGSTVTQTAILDLSKLAAFEALASNFSIGVGGRSGILNLAKESKVTTATIYVGSDGNSGDNNNPTSELNLGASTTLNVNDLYIGSGVDGRQTAKGIVRFQTPTVGEIPEVTIRGLSGAGTKTNLSVGRGEGLRIVTGLADFTLGKLNATLGLLEVGIGQSTTNATASTSGVFKMNDGKVTADNVVLGSSEGALSTLTSGTIEIGERVGGTSEFTAGSISMANNITGVERVQATLNINGGTVNVTGTLANSTTALQTGARAGTASSVVASINISGGLLNVSSGNIAEGADGAGVTSSITLNGGTIDMHAHSIAVDAFTVLKGTLKNIGSVSTTAGSGITKVSDGSGTGGTLTLDGTSAYSGATVVQAGTLLVQGRLTQSSVTIQSGATLGGSGSIASTVTIQSGGKLAPGNSPGILETGSLSILSGGILSMELNGGTEGSGYDQISTTGTISLDGVNLELTLGYAPVYGQMFTLLQNDGGDAIIGTLATVNGVALMGNTFSITLGETTYDFVLSYTGNGPSLTGGNDLILQVTSVPEPGISVLMVIAAGSLVVLHRRRRLIL